MTGAGWPSTPPAPFLDPSWRAPSLSLPDPGTTNPMRNAAQETQKDGCPRGLLQSGTSLYSWTSSFSSSSSSFSKVNSFFCSFSFEHASLNRSISSLVISSPWNADVRLQLPNVRKRPGIKPVQRILRWGLNGKNPMINRSARGQRVPPPNNVHSAQTPISD